MKKKATFAVLAATMALSLSACSLPTVGGTSAEDYEQTIQTLTDENNTLKAENESLKAQLAEYQTQAVLDSAVPAGETSDPNAAVDQTQTANAYSEADFESALNGGNDCTGLVVTFTVQELHPNSTFGYNLWAGEHLNFCSQSDPGVNPGDTLTVKVTGVQKNNASWIIYYE